ncbi:MAG: UDP-N-acetylmuramoyl-L-alanyl-D-glutamate--2,6-diaminopimelate ligase [Chloroflexota bacterium]|nr:MAG: UDP-N-acetylmuramoyl-L-alanyl-D-glutamate--2,6-diaminopimelate ligase [Chloroflexota bacterium]
MTTIAERIAAAEPPEPRPLGDLVARLDREGWLESGAPGSSAAGRGIRGLTHDSRQVRPGWLFVAVPGEHADGHAFVSAAGAAGAVAAIVERPVDSPIPQVLVRNARAALASAAGWWYGDPSAELGVIGITGTDGKTTTSFLATAALEAGGLPTGMLGTAALEVGDLREPNPEHATTPEAPRLQAILRAMTAAGDRAAVVETTSHGLALDRVAGIRYDIAILTNVTHEHLELHGTWEAYRDAKRSLFERLAVGPANPAKPHPGWPRTGIVNLDDPSAAAFAEATRRAGARLLTYSADVGRSTADVRATEIQVGRWGGGLHVRYLAPSGRGDLWTPLIGRFNVQNLLAVVALGEAIGLDPAAVRSGLESVASIPGRMERVEAGQPFEVIVDYAHTPASLEGALDELGALAQSRGGEVIVVFGSAGERDTQKRPEMGRIAGERCAVVVITDEDPRGEDREAILAEIAAGATAAGKQGGRDLLLVADRGAAIRAAFERARPGDVVLLAGKGHETTILYADGAMPWDERAEAFAALAELGWTPGA